MQFQYRHLSRPETTIYLALYRNSDSIAESLTQMPSLPLYSLPSNRHTPKPIYLLLSLEIKTFVPS